jgi:hypothetical protein
MTYRNLRLVNRVFLIDGHRNKSRARIYPNQKVDDRSAVMLQTKMTTLRLAQGFEANDARLEVADRLTNADQAVHLTTTNGPANCRSSDCWWWQQTECNPLAQPASANFQKSGIRWKMMIFANSAQISYRRYWKRQRLR